jgi:hypothetical protein
MAERVGLASREDAIEEDDGGCGSVGLDESSMASMEVDDRDPV